MAPKKNKKPTLVDTIKTSTCKANWTLNLLWDFKSEYMSLSNKNSEYALALKTKIEIARKLLRWCKAKIKKEKSKAPYQVKVPNNVEIDISNDRQILSAYWVNSDIYYAFIRWNARVMVQQSYIKLKLWKHSSLIEVKWKTHNWHNVDKKTFLVNFKKKKDGTIIFISIDIILPNT